MKNALWTIMITVEQMQMTVQLRAPDAARAMGKWLKRDPFRVLFGSEGARSWPTKTDTAIVEQVHRLPSMPGFYQGSISSLCNTRLATIQLVRTESEPSPKLPRLSVRIFRPVLASLLRKEVLRIAQLPVHEPYCALALDSNVCYGEVTLSLNTASCLKEFRARHADDEEFQVFAPYCTGDWSHRALCNESSDWESAWRPQAQRIADCIDAWSEENLESRIERWRTSFLCMLSELLVEMQEQHDFAALPTTSDFMVLVIDHDESQYDAIQRMGEVRGRYPASA